MIPKSLEVCKRDIMVIASEHKSWRRIEFLYRYPQGRFGSDTNFFPVNDAMKFSFIEAQTSWSLFGL
jgi:hypothetical protein